MSASGKFDAKTVKQAATKFLSFLNASPSPYHAVEQSSQLLLNAGFEELNESQPWNLRPASKYFVTRNKSTVIAFAIGGQWKPGQGFSMVAAHTDSPCFKLKPKSKLSAGGCMQVGVVPYGGGIWRTWFDRDLTIAGRVIVKTSDDKIHHRLVHHPKPILSIPNLAIHLDRESNDSFKHNKESHLRPVLATDHMEKLLGDGDDDNGVHHVGLLSLVAAEAKCEPDEILDFELCLCDTQPACLGGLHEEFVHGPRLDNLVGTYTAILGLIESIAGSGQDTNFAQDTNVRLVACYDNEECGSQSAQGAMSSVTEWVMRRINASPWPDAISPTPFEDCIPKSLLISADQAHALHPNYTDKYESENNAKFHKGVVVKINPNQRYATTAITHSILKEVALKAGVPLQPFVVRNDSPCGSTVGPILSAKLGLPTIDVGTTQLAMHSIREMADTTGIAHATQLFKEFFRSYPETFARLQF